MVTGLSGFRASCLTVAGLYVVIAGRLLLAGPAQAMATYGLEQAMLANPHYADAIFWVFLHMAVLGSLIGVVGWFATELRLQRAFAGLMLVATLVYTWLDVRSADWSLGSGLYRGPGSLAPVVVDLLTLLLWLRLVLLRPSAPSGTPLSTSRTGGGAR